MARGDAPDVERPAGEHPHPCPPGAAGAGIAGHEGGFSRGKCAIFAVTRADDGTLIAAIGSSLIDGQHQRGELGYRVGRPCGNRGYASEGAPAPIARGFRYLGLNRIQATHLTRNPASGRVLEKCGLVCEGHLRQHVKKGDVFEDIAIYGIVREDHSAGAM